MTGNPLRIDWGTEQSLTSMPPLSSKSMGGVQANHFSCMPVTDIQQSMDPHKNALEDGWRYSFLTRWDLQKLKQPGGPSGTGIH
eukprot:1943847-Ditylum_brightwellii.AAC.1